MKLAYNPIGAEPLNSAPLNNDITFDLPDKSIYVKGVKFNGKDSNKILDTELFGSFFTNYNTRYIKLGTLQGYTYLYEKVILLITRAFYANQSPISYIVTIDNAKRDGGDTIGKISYICIENPSNFVQFYLSPVKNGDANDQVLYADASKLFGNGWGTWSVSVLSDPHQKWKTSISFGVELPENHILASLDGKINESDITSNVIGTSNTSDSWKHIWFSHDKKESQRGYNDDFVYNPAIQTLKVTNLDGTANKIKCVAGDTDIARPIVLTNKSNEIYYSNQTTINYMTGEIIAPKFIGNLDGQYINKLTGYTKATTVSDVSENDSLESALSKIEFKADNAYQLVKGAYDGDGTIENLVEILKVLEGISDTDTIQSIIGKYLPLTGGILTGDLILHNPTENQDSPKLIFQRGTTSSNYTDWEQYVTAGHMIFTCNVEGSYVEKIRFVESGGILINNNNVLHAGNYNSYAPKLDGTGATGTWNIDIAGYATALLNTGAPKYVNCFEYKNGQIVIGEADGNAYLGSSGNWKLYSFPENSTNISTNNIANIQNIRLGFNDKYFHDIFLSPNKRYLWHRYVHNNTAHGWSRLVEEDCENTSNIWNISIGGSAKSVASDSRLKEGLQYCYATKVVASNDNTGAFVGYKDTDSYISTIRVMSSAAEGALYYTDLMFDVNSDSIWSRRVTKSGTPSLKQIAFTSDFSPHIKVYNFSTDSTNWYNKLFSFTYTSAHRTYPLTFSYSVRDSSKRSSHEGFVTIHFTGAIASGITVTGDTVMHNRFLLYCIEDSLDSNGNHTSKYEVYYDGTAYNQGKFWNIIYPTQVYSVQISCAQLAELPTSSVREFTSTLGSFGFQNDVINLSDVAKIKYGTHNKTLLGNYPLPNLGSYGIGLFTRPSESTDEGGLIITEDTCMIFNSGDTEWTFQVHNTDLSRKDFSVNNGTTSRVFGVTQDNFAYSLGGFKKSGSDNNYVLLGGGGHKTISDFMLKSDELTNNVTAFTKTLTVTQDWMDTGISGTNLNTGTYIVQVTGGNSSDHLWNCLWSGVLSWFSGNTNDGEYDEIILHRAGHAYHKTIYLRTIQTTNGNGGMKLQIAASSDLTSSGYTFKFKRII